MRTTIVAALLAALGGDVSAETVPLSDGQWRLEGTGTAIERFDGRDTLRMETGTAVRSGTSLQDGTIDFDVMLSRRRSFVYVHFRVVDEREHEEIYFRPHKSGLPDAVQYAPVFQGQSAWQLYHGPGGTAALAFEPGVWTHVRVVLKGRRAALFVGADAKPVMVSRLAREPRAGAIAFGSFVPRGTPGTDVPARFSNVSVRADAGGYVFPPEPPEKAADPGVIRAWSVSRAFAPKEPPPDALPAAATTGELQRVEASASGLVELHRYVRLPEPGAEPAAAGAMALPAGRQEAAAVARVKVRAAEAGRRRLDLGYSDRVTVFLNGRPLYQGDASYSFDTPRREGLIGYDQASLFLPLDKGDNELAVLVSDSFGGWGLMARFADPSGLTVEAR
jgi:hypothetical protein